MTSTNSSVSWFALGAPIVGGALLGIALLGALAGPLLAVGSLGLLFSSLQQTRSNVCSALLFGVTSGTISGFWGPEALSSLGSTPPESLIGLGVAVLWCAVPTYLVLGLISSVFRRLCNDQHLTALAFGLPALEALTLHMPGSVPWVLVGYSAADSPGLSQLAFVGGVPLISLAIGLVACALVKTTSAYRTNESARVPVSLFVGVAAIWLGGLPFAQWASNPAPAETDPVHFLAIQPAIPRAERLRPSLQQLNVDRLSSFTRHEIEAGGSDRLVVVWPENSVVDSGNSDAEAVAIASNAAASLNVPLILGVTRANTQTSPRTFSNSVISFDHTGETNALLDKHRGVPVIESVGSGVVAAAVQRLIGGAGDWSKVRPNSDIGPLEDENQAVVVLCFEILFPGVVEQRRSEYASAILNLADDSWVKSNVASNQLTSIARFRAIEQRLPLIRVAHGGLSAQFDAYGQLVESLPLERYASSSLRASQTRRPGAFERLTILVLPVGVGLGVWCGYPLVGRATRRSRAQREQT